MTGPRVATLPLAPAVEPKTVRGFDPATSVEVLGERDAFTTVFANVDGSKTAKVATAPVNFKTLDGSWVPIDTTLVRRGSGRWEPNADRVSASFAATAVESGLASMDLGAGRSAGFGLAGTVAVTGQAARDSVTYAGVRPGTDLSLQVLAGGGVKEKLVLANRQAGNVWVFPLQLNGVTPKLDRHGGVELIGDDGSVAGRVPPGFMEDANRDGRSGSGVRSEKVTYRVLAQRGGWALEVTADRAWLDDPARVFPVTVDPTAVWNYGTTADTYTQTGYGSSTYTEFELRAGTWNGGANKARTYLGFPQVTAALRNSTIYDVDLHLFHIWSYSCSAQRAVSVHPVTQSWSQASIAAFPGPAHGPALVSSAAFSRGYIAAGSTSSACPAAWQGIDLGEGGKGLVQGWVSGTKPNYGLAVNGSATDSQGWKKFASRETPNGPYLTVTYSPYNAGYAFAESPPKVNPPVLNDQPGFVKVKVTNKGHDTWTPTNGYRLQYSVFNSAGNAVFHVPAQTAMPSNVAFGQTATVNAKINALPPGTWTIRFDMIHVTSNGYALYSEWGVPRTAVMTLAVPDVPPQLTDMYPHNNYEVGTLTPQLFADAESVDQWPSGVLKYSFSLCAPPWITWEWCLTSPWSTSPVWQVPNTDPVKRLGWSKEYYWSVAISDSGGNVTQAPLYMFKTGVQQPAITSHLAGGGKELNPQNGNFTTAATDANVATVGPPLSVVRTYNSLDPRTTNAFGEGWSTRFDMKAEPDADGSGNVVVTYPDGQQVRFGKNPDGSFASPPGRQATFAAVSGGGWKLMDKASTSYLFDAAGRLTSVTDHRGRAQTLSYGTDGKLERATATGGRALTFTWTGNHVTQVRTDPVNGAPLTWTYSYTGDVLTQVCAPVAAPNCTSYAPTGGSHYRSVVMDTNPVSYWRLGETSGTTAPSQIATNFAADNGTYTGVTLNTATGALAGTTDKAARFTGSSQTKLTDRAVMRAGTYLAVELWFKTTGKGVLLSYQNKAAPAAPTNFVPAVYIGNDGKLRGQFWRAGGAAPITSTAAVNNGQWHHVVLSGAGNTQSLYLDGNLVGAPLTGTIDHLHMQFAHLGTGWTSTAWNNTPATAGNFPFTGDLDEVAIYDKPLGLPSVREHYQARLAAQQLATVTQPSGRAYANVTYDVATDRIATHTDRHGGLWKLSNQVVTGTVEAPTATITLTDPRNGATVTAHDPLRGGRMTSQTDQLGHATTFEYDQRGFLAKVTDPNNNPTAFWRDERGNMLAKVRCRDADTCHSEYFHYLNYPDNPFDPRNDQVHARLDGRSSGFLDGTYLSRWTYNEHGDQTAETTPATPGYPDGRTTTRAYTDGTEAAVGGGTTPAGLLETSSDARGKTTSYAYTKAGDLARVTDPVGLVTEHTHDPLGRVTSTKVTSTAFPDGVTTSYTYDGRSQPRTETRPAVKNETSWVTHTPQAQHTYDPDGNLLTQTLVDLTGGDPNRVVTNTYDPRGRLETVTDPEGGIERFAYDATGARTSVTNKAATRHTYTYSVRGDLETTTLKGYTGNPNNPTPPADIVVESRAYDPGGRLASVTDAMGRTRRYLYTGDDRLARTVAENARLNGDTEPVDVIVEERSYDPAGNLARVVTGGGKTRTDYTWDAAGRITGETLDPDDLARRTDRSYDAANNLIRVARSAAGTDRVEAIEYGYNDANKTIRKTVENGGTDLTTTYTVDQRGLTTSTVDPRGNLASANPDAYRTTMDYDEAGQLIETTEPPVQVQRGENPSTTIRPTTRFGYNTAYEQTHVTDQEGRTTTTTYDLAGRPTTITRPSYDPPGAAPPMSPRSVTEYDAAGRPIKQTDARDNVRTFTYDQLDRVARITEPLLAGHATAGQWTFEHDLVNELLAQVDPTGARIEATFDDLGRKITSTVVERRPAAAALTTRLTYDDAGNPTAVTRPAGDTTKSTYNAASEAIELLDPLNNTYTVTRDGVGRETHVRDPLGRTQLTEYDLAGRATAVRDRDADGQIQRSRYTSYDAAGNPTTSTSAEGHLTTRTFDAANRLTRLVEPVSDTESITTTFGHDATGARTRVTDGRNNTVTTTYNTLGLIEAVTEPSTAAHPHPADRTWTAGYDANGNPVTETVPGNVTRTRTFDALDRLTGETGTGAETTTPGNSFGYDLAGRRTTVNTPGGQITYGYNDQSKPLTVTSPTGGTAQYTYDPNGRVSARVDKAGAAAFSWNANDDLATATDPVTGTPTVLTYNDAAQLATVTYGTGGAKRVYTHDALGRVDTDELTNDTGSVLAAASYDYDAEDRIVAKTSTGTTGAGPNTYGYDHAGRLTRWTAPDGAATHYEWDPAGNRTKAGATTATYDQRNRVLSNGATTYTHSPRGTRTAQSTATTTTTSAYDAFDRLTSDNGVTYTYDGLGRVAERANGTTSARFAYSTDRNDPTALIAGDGSTAARYGRTPDGALLSTAETGAPPALTVTDHHDDLTARFTPGGAALATSTNYDPFGTRLGHTGPASSLGYQSEYTDPGNGRVNMHSRWYTPETGGFASRDSLTVEPVGSVQANRYSYGNAEPLGNTDPSGHCPPCAIAGGAAISAGAIITAVVVTVVIIAAIAVIHQAWINRDTGSSSGNSTRPNNSNPQNPPRPCTVNCKPQPPGGQPPGGGGPAAPRPPSLQQLRLDAIKDAAYSPAARVATVAGVSQSLIDQIRDGAEKTVEAVAGAQATNGLIEVFAGENARAGAASGSNAHAGAQAAAAGLGVTANCGSSNIVDLDDPCFGEDDLSDYERKNYKNPTKKHRTDTIEGEPVCQYCGRNPSAEYEHILAQKTHWNIIGRLQDRIGRSDFINHPHNVTGACKSCNASKGARELGRGPGQWWPSGWRPGEWFPFKGRSLDDLLP